MKKTIKSILQEKGSKVHSIGPQATVAEALAAFAEFNVGALLVIDSQGHVSGIISERDYARRVELEGRSSDEIRVADIMTTQVCYVRPGQSVEEGLALVTEQRCRHLPVMDGHELLGLVSIGDLVKATIEEKEFLIDQLTHYIKSG